MKRRVLLALTGVLLLTNGAMAGWYKVENFEGWIGVEPVHLSLQMYEFGSGLTVEGSYYRDAPRVAIAVYGTSNGAAVQLCEIADREELEAVIVQGSATPFDTSGCPIALVLDEAGASGTRTVDGQDEAIALTRVARLDDTEAGKVEGVVEIPFWHHTDAHMLIGLYAKAGDFICLETMQLINKASGAVDQEIDFDTERCDVGTVMTPIYMNVEFYMDQSAEVVFVNVKDGGAGTTIDYDVDARTGLLSLK